ncbi:MAG: hypothetical protein V1743_03905, partial [Nanoarchaeota archaeon]
MYFHKRRIKYPKLTILLFIFFLAYLIFTGSIFSSLFRYISSMGYLGSFLLGIFFVYGFTAPPATALLLLLAKSQNIFVTALIAGVGALVGDLVLFRFIRHSFGDEIERLKKERLVKHMYTKTPGFIKKYFIPVIGGFIIASPLPDEIGIS